MKMKKFLAMTMAMAMVAGLATGCGSSSEGGSSEGGATQGSEAASSGEQGSVYYLNFKPEVAEVWESIAKQYTEETGVDVKIKTAASGQYEQTLKSEIAKKDAPTLFQINGPQGYANWKDYTMDLKDTDLYSMLLDPELAITDGEGVYGIPYIEEGYGIIYNAEIMDKYFAMDGAKVKSVDEINNFDTLKAVVEDMTAKKADLGIDGVFSSTSFAPGEDWRWQTHLLNLPIHYEYEAKGVTDEAEITFDYNENFKNIFDLYINNSVTEPAMVGSKSVDDSMAEFALGKSAMVQNGNWAWGQISAVEGNTVKEDKIKFMPIYTGMEGEETQGICIGTENYLCVNTEASDADKQASLDFMKWVFSSDEGKDIVTNQLGFITPFNTFSEEESPSDPLAKEVIRYMGDSKLTSVSWDFQTFPSQTFKDNLGAALLQYSTGSEDWTQVVEDTIADWKVEKEATAE
ncbi:MAG: ABC transporter substrate-binding protein [Lachnospiraceae bacterium]|nr:ABC transporter substrate-binding protein [Lachnospiraceae bacterium]